MVVQSVGGGLVGCQTVPGMKKPIQHVRPENRSGIGKGLMVLPQPEIFLKEF